MDLLIRNAALRNRPGRWMIAAEGGLLKFVEPEDRDAPEAGTVIDADGHLVTEPFVDGHLHLCKVHTLDLAGPSALADYTGGGMGAAMTAIETAAAVKAGQSTAGVRARARAALTESVRHGVRRVQAFASSRPTCSTPGPTPSSTGSTT